MDYLNSLKYMFLPHNKHHPELQRRLRPGVESFIDINKLKKFKPVLVGLKGHYRGKVVSWKDIQKLIKDLNNIKPTGELTFMHHLHLAVDCYHIPYNDIDELQILR